MATQVKNISSLIFKFSRQLKERVHIFEGNRESMLRWGTLHYIDFRGKPLASEIADHLCITRPSASSLLRSLQRAGFIRRSIDQRDKRAIHIELSPRGRAYLRRGHDQIAGEIADMVKVLGARERRDFENLLKKIITYNEHNV